jgi:hypothetical protein
MEDHEILGVQEGASAAEVKRAYHKQALQWHPDKNPSPMAKEKFLKINDAYQRLSKLDSPPLFGDIVVDAIKWLLSESPILTDEIIDRIKGMMRDYTEYVTPLMREYFLSKLKPVIVIKPTINDLLEMKVYLHEETFTVPVWHHELEFEKKIIRCVPTLPPDMELDPANDIHLTIRSGVAEVLRNGEIVFYVGKLRFRRDAASLNVAPVQTFSLYGCGIPRVNTEDILDTSTLGDVHVTLYFT